jgi:hypothetical protein
MRTHVRMAAVALAATMLGASVTMAPTASAASSKVVKRSDMKACKSWKPAASGLLNVVLDVVVEDAKPTRALRKKVLRYADQTREASAAAKSKRLRIGLRHAAEGAEAWAASNLGISAAEDLVDELVVPMDRCMDLT